MCQAECDVATIESVCRRLNVDEDVRGQCALAVSKASLPEGADRVKLVSTIATMECRDSIKAAKRKGRAVSKSETKFSEIDRQISDLLDLRYDSEKPGSDEIKAVADKLCLAVGFVTKRVDTIKRVLQDLSFKNAVKQAAAEHFELSLEDREELDKLCNSCPNPTLAMQIVSLRTQGYTLSECAAELRVGTTTVDEYVARLADLASGAE